MSTGHPDTLHTDAHKEGGDPAVCSALSLIAAGALSGFAWLADDAANAPDLTSRMLLSRMAARELAPLDPVQAYQREIGMDEAAVEEQIWSYRALLADLEARTVPRDWWERLISTYIGFGLVLDLQRELVAGMSGRPAAIAQEALADSGLGDFVVERLAPAVAQEQQLAARLALWGRRVVGEGLGMASRLVSEHRELAVLAGIVPEGTEVSAEVLSPTMGRLTSEHARRMGRLGLTA
ncbi:ferritin-like fold-containing protein [Serinibacter salmoneus]|uniref:tRNA-(MS[2]IO[6]A)-hydroxylase MiaE-like protein n=1 Tax=Serinibacter salmoneus TaxID=556530 RepID=A0A2A9CXG9_9MICO|nr:ferritin-like fold-containing protein [Serinibacter salmoneus]PFG19128.1 tRNA-(MS[2]IO[6]A)-hydroxylase MiaE-like protein [Serinibacter salmoneus]